jgi:hypothetical protein
MCEQGSVPVEYPGGWFHDDIEEGTGHGSWPFFCKGAPSERMQWDAAKAAAPVPPAKGGGFVCSACDLRMDAAPVTPKRLTDETIRLAVIAYDDLLEANTEIPVDVRLAMGTAYGAGMREARDQGYTGGLSVERVMQVVKEWDAQAKDGKIIFYADLEQRLTKALNDQ